MTVACLKNNNRISALRPPLSFSLSPSLSDSSSEPNPEALRSCRYSAADYDSPETPRLPAPPAPRGRGREGGEVDVENTERKGLASRPSTTATAAGVYSARRVVFSFSSSSDAGTDAAAAAAHSYPLPRQLYCSIHGGCCIFGRGCATSSPNA